VPNPLDQLGHPRDGGRAEHQVHVRSALLDAPLLQLSHAAHDPDDQLGSLALEVLQRPQLRVHLVLRLLSDGAGVEQDEVSVFWAIGQLVPLLPEQPGYALGVVLVHLAAVGDQVELGHQSEIFFMNGRDLR
jgi:hypothetical protein